jgi:hypothetical protein
MVYVFHSCLPSRGIERDETAANFATLVVGHGAGGLFT